jgi:hypothetical protein
MYARESERQKQTHVSVEGPVHAECRATPKGRYHIERVLDDKPVSEKFIARCDACGAEVFRDEDDKHTEDLFI